MNELVFIILVFVGSEDSIANFKSPIKSFATIKECNDGRKEIFGGDADIFKRSRCVAVFPDEEKVVETPKAKCVRPLSDGFNAGKKCVEV